MTQLLYVQRQGWTSRECRAVSLVFKAGFFLRPESLVPMDQFLKEGLNRLRADRGTRKLNCESYKPYLEAFDDEYASAQAHLKLALNQPWVAEMADRLGCPRDALASLTLRRKLFDDYLMHTGGYKE